MNPKPSVLIIQTAFIGDVILATALVESIKAQLPESSIDFVVRKGNESLLTGNPNLRTVYILDKKRKYASLLELASTFRKNKYDYIINVQRFATTGILTALSGATTSIGFDKNPLSFLFNKKIAHEIGSVHEVNRNLKLVKPMGIDSLKRPRLYPTKANFDHIASYKSGPFITVSPASVWFTKQWPMEKWAEFLNQLRDLKVYLLGGPEDVGLCESLAKSVTSTTVTTLAGKLSFLESAALMSGARMNYVNDSAPMHLASAMNAPVTAVFCSTVPAFGFGPLSDSSTIVEIEEKLNCRPCGLHGYKACPEGHFRCAMEIRAERLLKILG